MTREDQDKRQSILTRHSTHFLWLDQRFRKAFTPPFSSPFRLIVAKSSQELGEDHFGWNRVE